MVRHTIELWSDGEDQGVLVNWKVDEVDWAEVYTVAQDLELRGSKLWVARQLSTVLTMALLYGPARAAERINQLEPGSAPDPTLF